jgi:hypothetical protein
MCDYQKPISSRPNHYVCGWEGCPAWDNINGCGKSFDSYLNCDFDLVFYYDDEDWEELIYEGNLDPESHCSKCFKYSELLESGKCPMCFELDGCI